MQIFQTKVNQKKMKFHSSNFISRIFTRKLQRLITNMIKSGTMCSMEYLLYTLTIFWPLLAKGEKTPSASLSRPSTRSRGRQRHFSTANSLIWLLRKPPRTSTSPTLALSTRQLIALSTSFMIKNHQLFQTFWALWALGMMVRLNQTSSRLRRCRTWWCTLGRWALGWPICSSILRKSLKSRKKPNNGNSKDKKKSKKWLMGKWRRCMIVLYKTTLLEDSNSRMEQLMVFTQAPLAESKKSTWWSNAFRLRASSLFRFSTVSTHKIW